MAFYKDSALSFELLKTAIETACESNGWTLDDGILSKSNCFFKLTADTLTLKILGGTSKIDSSLTDTPIEGNIGIRSYDSGPIIFPINYDIHIFTDPDEVYVFVNYNVDFYQHLNFGKSNLQGIGLGSWYSASDSQGTNSGSYDYFNLNTSQIGDTITVNSITSVGLACGFFSCSNRSFINTDLDLKGWTYPEQGSYQNYTYSLSVISGLFTALPNAFNQANVLLPIKGIIARSSGGITICCNMVNARFLRLDNIQSEDIITFGSEQWKCYPLYRRNIVSRNGGTDIDHSGTYGVAIKYTGA